MNVDDISYTPEVILRVLHTMRDGGFEPGRARGHLVRRLAEHNSRDHISAIVSNDSQLDNPTCDEICVVDCYRAICTDVVASMSEITDRQRQAVMRVHIGGQLLREASLSMGVTIQCVSKLSRLGVRGMSAWLGS